MSCRIRIMTDDSFQVSTSGVRAGWASPQSRTSSPCAASAQITKMSRAMMAKDQKG
jgi:hypothetical protein